MKKSRAETAETRRRIVETAARTFTSNGIHATGVAEIMSAAGLTQGGFYRHFASKDQLVAEACAAGMSAIVCSVEAAAQEGNDRFLKHFESYLMEGNRDDFLGACPLVATGSELARADMDTRRAASHGLREIISIMAGHNGTASEALAEGRAIFAFSAMVGAVTLSRIVDDAALADAILDETRRRLNYLLNGSCDVEHTCRAPKSDWDERQAESLQDTQ
ncbi:TetR/AcrR family transcriptional regulator (plasmid) [Paraburkholderia strydomiana]